MPAATELQKLVKLVLQPWKYHKEKPPFSPVDLLVLALGSMNKDMTETRIFYWIRQSFPYYGKLARRYPADEEVYAFSNMDEDFKAYEAPAIKTRAAAGGDIVWKICPDEAFVYLQQRYGPKPAGVFKFLDLPPEIRATIYDMVFQYPASGLLCTVRDHSLQTMTKDLNTPFSAAEWTKQIRWPSPGTYKQSMGEALEPLLINKQIFGEAFPCFYRLNLLICDSAYAAYSFLQEMASYRRQHITQFGFRYSSLDTEYAARLFDYIASLPNLQKLYIDIDEQRWEMNYGPLQRGHIDVINLPGLHKLRKIRVQEVIFSETCPKIAASVKAVIEGAGEKKRKASEVEVVAREPRGRAAKRGKKNYAPGYSTDEIDMSIEDDYY